MMLHGASTPTTLILGAGATRGAIRHVLVNRKRLKPPLNRDFFDIASTYARAYGATSTARLKRLERVLSVIRAGATAKKGHLTMEEAFGFLYTAKDFPNIYRSGPGPRPNPGELREISDFFHFLFGILTRLDDTGRTAETGYDRLASCLEPTDRIITLNYDTCLDSALRRRGWDPSKGYGLLGGTRKFRWRALANPGHNNAEGVELLKLHGSANWWVRGSLRRLSRAFESKPVLISPPRANSLSRHIRQIIPPIYGKVFQHAHWRHLWQRAFHAICSAQALVVIGCSIVDTDYHLQALLRRAALERQRNGNRLRDLLLVDRVSIRRRWQRVLHGAPATLRGYRSLEAFLRKELKV